MKAESQAESNAAELESDDFTRFELEIPISPTPLVLCAQRWVSRFEALTDSESVFYEFIYLFADMYILGKGPHFFPLLCGILHFDSDVID